MVCRPMVSRAAGNRRAQRRAVAWVKARPRASTKVRTGLGSCARSCPSCRRTARAVRACRRRRCRRWALDHRDRRRLAILGTAASLAGTREASCPRNPYKEAASLVSCCEKWAQVELSASTAICSILSSSASTPTLVLRLIKPSKQVRYGRLVQPGKVHQLDRVQPALALLDLGDVGLWLTNKLGDAHLRQARVQTRLPQARDERAVAVRVQVGHGEEVTHRRTITQIR